MQLTTLANGLRVASRPMRSVETIAVGLYAGTGSRHEPERLNGLAGVVRSVVPDARWISAGMTADFAEAIAAGATHLRIGSAITGPRPQRG